MGNLCLKHNINDYANDTRYICKKCGDYRNLLKKRTRTHCRIHNFNTNNYCKDCGIYIAYSHKHCYHDIKKRSFFY